MAGNKILRKAGKKGKKGKTSRAHAKFVSSDMGEKALEERMKRT